jgi:KIF-1 binding protein C terminal
MGKYRHCAVSLASAESVLKQYVSNKSAAEGSSSVEMNVADEEIAELTADLNRRWARLDARILKEAFNIENTKRATLEAGLEWTDLPVPADDDDDDDNDDDNAVASGSSGGTRGAGKNKSSGSIRTVEAPQGNADTVPEQQQGGLLVELFRGLPVQDTPLMHPNAIKSFDNARVVFLRATSRLEAAKKFFVLDGTYVRTESSSYSLVCNNPRPRSPSVL